MTDLQWQSYVAALRSGGFQKLARLRFLNPDGTTAFALDNNPYNPDSRTFIKSGNTSCNLQNGERWSANVTLANPDGEFDFRVEKVWFGTEIAAEMGIALPDGTELYFPFGVYRIPDPSELVSHDGNTVSFAMKDKWCGIDGTMNGKLESSYIVNAGTNIFSPIAAILASDRGDGQPFDNVAPVFTEYYNGKTQTLPGGGTAAITDAPFTLTVDNEDGSVADVVLGLTDMLVALVGYDASGRLRIDPSQNDVEDNDKAVGWRFMLNQPQIAGRIEYKSLVSDVVNDYIVTGWQRDDFSMPSVRAQNLDPLSPTNINRIGRRTKRESKPEFATQRICEDWAVWQLKRQAALRKSVSFPTNQVFHLAVNEVIEIVRTDKPNAPTERHLLQGFTMPFAGNEPMTITAVSIHDFPTVTVTRWGE